MSAVQGWEWMIALTVVVGVVVVIGVVIGLVVGAVRRGARPAGPVQPGPPRAEP